MQFDLEKICPRCMQEGVVNDYCTLCKHPVPAKQNPNNALPLKTVIHGQYVIGKVLGAGGFGVTYVALDLHDGHKVAIKEYFPNSLSSRAMGQTQVFATNESEFAYGLKHFLSEARTLHSLAGTPNIIRVEKLFSENNTAYFAMEFLQGSDLREYLSNHGDKISFQQTVELLFPLMMSLSQVHEKGVIHRDIAPDNIFMLDSGEIKLIDFGAAHTALSRQSVSFNHVIKPGYGPIEQHINNKENPQGPWTDVHALAGTIYRCITGRRPEDCTKRLSNPECLPMPSALGVSITPRQEEILMRGMALRAVDRYQNVREFAQALVDSLNDQGMPQPPVPPMPPVPDMGGNGFVPPPMPVPMPVKPKRTLLDFIFFWRLFRKPRMEMPPQPVIMEQTETEREATVPAPLPEPPSPPPMPPAPVPVQIASSPYCLTAVQGVLNGAMILLYSEHIRMGRHSDYCDIVFPQDTRGVSNQHMAVWYDAMTQRVMVEDLGSTYGTFIIVNDMPRKLSPHVVEALREGDSVMLGNERFVVKKVR